MKYEILLIIRMFIDAKIIFSFLFIYQFLHSNVIQLILLSDITFVLKYFQQN